MLFNMNYIFWTLTLVWICSIHHQPIVSAQNVKSRQSSSSTGPVAQAALAAVPRQSSPTLSPAAYSRQKSFGGSGYQGRHGDYGRRLSGNVDAAQANNFQQQAHQHHQQQPQHYGSAGQPIGTPVVQYPVSGQTRSHVPQQFGLPIQSSIGSSSSGQGPIIGVVSTPIGISTQSSISHQPATNVHPTQSPIGSVSGSGPIVGVVPTPIILDRPTSSGLVQQPLPGPRRTSDAGYVRQEIPTIPAGHTYAVGTQQFQLPSQRQGRFYAIPIPKQGQLFGPQDQASQDWNRYMAQYPETVQTLLNSDPVAQQYISIPGPGQTNFQRQPIGVSNIPEPGQINLQRQPIGGSNIPGPGQTNFQRQPIGVSNIPGPGQTNFQRQPKGLFYQTQPIGTPVVQGPIPTSIIAQPIIQAPVAVPVSGPIQPSFLTVQGPLVQQPVIQQQRRPTQLISTPLVGPKAGQPQVIQGPQIQTPQPAVQIEVQKPEIIPAPLIQQQSFPQQPGGAIAQRPISVGVSSTHSSNVGIPDIQIPRSSYIGAPLIQVGPDPKPQKLPTFNIQYRKPLPQRVQLTHDTPIMTRTQIHTPIMLGPKEPTASDYSYTINQPMGVYSGGSAPGQTGTGPMRVYHLPSIRTQQPVYQQNFVTGPAGSATGTGGGSPNLYYRLPVQTVRTTHSIQPISNFLIPPYMHRYPISIVSDQFSNGQPTSQQVYDGQGRPITTVTIEELPQQYLSGVGGAGTGGGATGRSSPIGQSRVEYEQQQPGHHHPSNLAGSDHGWSSQQPQQIQQRLDQSSYHMEAHKKSSKK